MLHCSDPAKRVFHVIVAAISAPSQLQVPLNVRAVLDIPVVKGLLLDIELMVFLTHASVEQLARTYLKDVSICQ